MLVNACLLGLPEEQKKKFRIIVTAPTGKAVAQLEENVRKNIAAEASLTSGTLHAILGIRSLQQEEEETVPLFADLILVDECSMIDVKLFSRLLESVSEGARLVLIGDRDQLPPVEAGSIFADLLEADIFPVTHLVTCLRSERSEILTLARQIREGNQAEALSFSNANAAIEWIDSDHLSPSEQLSQLWDRCKERFPSVLQHEPDPEQITGKTGAFGILSCMRQGPLGVDAVNRYFLERYETLAHASDVTGDAPWWVMPIMIIRNDYELELFNGDQGILVRTLSPEFSLRKFHMDDYALFRDRRGGYRQISAPALPPFEYSYCLSVHKSQGSEYDAVLLLFPSGSEQFGREVLYTAVTRARIKVSLSGSRELLERAIGLSSRKTSGLIPGVIQKLAPKARQSPGIEIGG
jgi:exodeoxyribonuclease V alpha subunit